MESDGDGMIIQVMADWGRTRLVTIACEENYVEVCMASSLSYDDWEDVPHGLCVWLLNQNFLLKMGYWCVADAGGSICVTANERIPASLFNGLHLNMTLGVLERHCDALDQKVREWASR